MTDEDVVVSPTAFRPTTPRPPFDPLFSAGGDGEGAGDDADGDDDDDTIGNTGEA
eukprot:CAMPEP_0185756924 /NCGR_PEP_ID=MMETSP1174-20130828/15316_1 /TAXON_ID=35687 /ORGANISM="Dictyocha speculum, Strain CCMP1381" /LENGTH=54 /DNA_ID=CAMNT_0028436093 /DNA_START=74 /DNA_END=235 /DNA_ORIENTATION=+